MNLSIVKNEIKNEIGKMHTFRCKLSRGQSLVFNGSITKCYPAIFIVSDDNGNIYSFSYNDYIISNIKIVDVKRKK